MKNRRKRFEAMHGMAIIALAAAIGFGVAGCENPIDPTHTHQWGEWTVTPATCIAVGEKTRTCALDATHTETVVIPIDTVNGHDWGEWTGTVTCTTAGTGRRVCLLNTEHTEEGDTIPALGHNYQNWTETTAPTCTVAGVETGTCTHDNSHTTTRAGAAAFGHDYQTYTEKKPPTCSEVGKEEAPCTRDSNHEKSIRDIPIDPDTHDWNTVYTTIAAATATTDGIEALTCKHNSSHTKESRFNGEYATGTEGLSFTAINSNTAYRVSRGTATGVIHIPAYYRPDADSSYLSVTTISGDSNSSNSNAFGGTSASPDTTVTSITFAEGSQLTYISGYAFYYCQNLASIIIPEGVISIGGLAFSGCTSLTSITVVANNTNYTSQDGIVYNKAKTSIVAVPTGIIGNVTLPASLTSIGDRAFFECINLTSITIPEGVTEIGYVAFQGCTNLASITIPMSVMKISMQAFAGCRSLAGSIVIPEGVTEIGQFTFQNCTSLTSIIIPISVTTVSQSAFNGLTASQTIYVKRYASESASNASTADGGWNYWLYSCNAFIKYLQSDGTWKDKNGNVTTGP